MNWLPRKQIVVPIDFSDSSLEAVEVALSLAESPADVRVLYVLPNHMASEPGLVWNILDEATQREKSMSALRERLSDAKYHGVKLAVAFGDPGSEIVELADQVSADLIVISSHGRTGIPRLLIGSVAERVTRHASCPVLVLRWTGE